MAEPKMPIERDKGRRKKGATAITDRYLGRSLGPRPIKTSLDQANERKANRARRA